MGYLSHPYAWRLRSASFAGATIERLQYRDTLEIAIRFADWRGRSFNPKALEIGENELLVLLGDALSAHVFSGHFCDELRSVLKAEDAMPAKAFNLFWANMSEDVATPNDGAFKPGVSARYGTLGDALRAAKTPPNATDVHPWIQAAHCLLSPTNIATINGLIDRSKGL